MSQELFTVTIFVFEKFSFSEDLFLFLFHLINMAAAIIRRIRAHMGRRIEMVLSWAMK